MTSIEWLIKELYTEMNMSGDGRVLDEILEEARHKHKQEMGDTWDAAIFRNAQRGYNASRTFEDFDDYYQETFVSKKKIKFNEEEWSKLNNESKGSDEVELPKHPSVISENGNELLFDKEGNLTKELPQQETLYTEEQVREAIDMADKYGYLLVSEKTEIIQSLKQPKKD